MQKRHSLDIERTADGSVTLYFNELDEHYHSVKGAVAESRHVYLGLGWDYYRMTHERMRVFEVGFGTGLNAALTALRSHEEGVMTDYHAVELYPLPGHLADLLASHQDPKYAEDFRAVNAAPWDNQVQINPHFTLTKIKENLLTMDLPKNLDVVYFDAFAPEKQPEMWTEDVFRRIFDVMVEGGVLTTYCAKGDVRRLLEKVGFTVERLAGPVNGKREVLRGKKLKK